MVRIILLISLLYGVSFSAAQNIIPNGSFEKMSDFNCKDDPITAFKFVEDWTSFWTAYLWKDGCTYDASIWFHDFEVQAIDGYNSFGIIGGLFSNSNYGSVYAVTPLETTLVTGQRYYFQTQIRNGGVRHPKVDSLKYCITDDPKQVEVFFGNQNLLLPDSFPLNTPYDLRFTSTDLQGRNSGDWNRYADCFVADAADSHLTVSLSRGNVIMNAPCIFQEDPALLQFNYIFDIDDLILYPIPDRVDTVFSNCRKRDIEIDLVELIRLPKRVPIAFLWDDGSAEVKRTLREPGEYVIQAELDCAVFPITITIQQADCVADVFIPNAFSPNYDGYNDELRVFIDAEFPIQNYRFEVFDRWGNQVFKSTTISDFWSGRWKGKEQSEGIYTWLLSFELYANDTAEYIQEQGSVTIIK